jgi:hypothetical protein
MACGARHHGNPFPRIVWFIGSLALPNYRAMSQTAIVHFFCSSKRNEPKKRAPETKNSDFLSACYAGHKGATKKPEFGFAELAVGDAVL